MIRRGTGERNGARGRFPEYSARRGQNRYEANRSCCHKHTRVTADNPFVVWALSMIRSEHWSIDACVGYAQTHDLFPGEDIICTKTFYNAMWNGTISLTPFDLPEALKRRSKKARIHKNKRIFGRSIDERAEVAASREEIGHWEIDTVVGKKFGSESVVLTIVEKVTDFYIAMKIPGKDPLSVMRAMEVLREEYGEKFSSLFKTITADNGTEFSELNNLEKREILVYFTHPCSSWERLKMKGITAFSDALHLREDLLIDILPSRSSNMLTA
ncbi:IS30 family transposase [Mogibacterium diversum]|uniref:IS30 family transposase n=1 Tax=Mogibacterium diversum TaxID=114527 RepID=UPI0028D31261|nr:IS30 family transposase [Mogibacterium diversum]